MKLIILFIFSSFLVGLSSCNTPNEEKVDYIDAYEGWNFLIFDTGIDGAFIKGIDREKLANEELENPNFVFDTNLILPTTFNGLPIIRINVAAFENLGLNSVDFSNMHFLQSISYNAFQNNYITSLDFSNLKHLGYISNNAFSNNHINTIHFNDYIEEIGNGAFRDNNLSSVYLKNMSRLISLGNNAFANNSPSIDVTLENLDFLRNLNLSAFSGSSVTLRLIDLSNLERVTPSTNNLYFNTIYILGTTHGDDIELRDWWINRETSFGFYNDNIFNLGD